MGVIVDSPKPLETVIVVVVRMVLDVVVVVVVVMLPAQRELPDT